MNITIDKEFQTLLAPLTAEEYAGLEQDILDKGCLDTLKIWQGILIDGHNRYSICMCHGVLFDVQELEFDSRDEVIEWIIRHQLSRRNQTPEQISYYRGKLYEQMKKIHGGDRKSSGNNFHLIPTVKTAERIAKDYNVTEKTIRNDADYARAIDTIAAEAGEDVKQQILSGELSVTKQDVIQLAQVPAEERREIVAQGETEILRAAKEIRARKTEERRVERVEKIAEISKATIAPLGSFGQYPIILADPPWRYDFSKDDADEIENHYPTMSLDEICALPVADSAFDDCVLFMWATSPKLEDAFKVINAWGFQYRTCAIWDKEWIGPGYYFRQRHELLLVATRGAVPVPPPNARPDSVFTEKRTAHSKKPDVSYQLIESMYLNLPKLELFSRTPREGWTAWGNQAQEIQS